MTIDYNKNNYTKIGNYSNILYEWPKDGAADYATWSAEVAPRIMPLFHKVAMAHPEWTLILSGGNNNTAERKKYGVHKARVICDDEIIGLIDIDHWKSGHPFTVSCDKIASARERGRAAWTTKLERAYKLVEENFAPVSLVSKVQRAASNVSQLLSTMSYNKQSAFGSGMGKLHPALAAYIVNNLAAISKAPEFAGVSVALEVIPSLVEEKRVVDMFSNAVRNGQGYVVLTYKDKYLVHSTAAPSGDFHVLTAGDLTEDMASKIGLLKALDTDDEVIDGVGFRTKGNTYFIL